MSELTSQIERRRTFAIISHPDAGKTTLTEKFLLYGGAIQKNRTAAVLMITDPGAQIAKPVRQSARSAPAAPTNIA